MSVRLEQIGAAWNRLAHEDPLWAVCVSPNKKGNRWNPGEFYATGEQEISTVLKRTAELGLGPKHARALDFGCGVGRLSFALARQFNEVVGVDISDQMLALADAAAKESINGQRCRFLRNDGTDLAMFGDASFDFVYSSLVLQHMPVKFSSAYLTEFIRVLKPGGTAVFHIPANTVWTVKGALFRWAPRWVLAAGQRFVLGYPAPMEMHCMAPRQVRELLMPVGAQIVATDQLELEGSQWQDIRYYVRKS